MGSDAVARGVRLLAAKPGIRLASMKNTPRLLPFLCVSPLWICTPAFADFSGKDPLVSSSSNWDVFASKGAGKLVFQNSRLEFLVKSPTQEDQMILGWQRNQGGIDQDWFIQVDAHLDAVPLGNGAFTNLNLAVVDSSNTKSNGYSLAIDRYRDGTRYVSNINIGSINHSEDEIHNTAATDVTLRIHHDSAAKTITASWKSGKTWRYFAPVSIKGWGMSGSDQFLAAVVGSGGGSDDNRVAGPKITSGAAYFRNFKAGNASPDIAVEQPAGSSMVDGTAKRSFGTVTVGESAVRTFTIRNEGTAKLKGISITTNGANAADFTAEPPAGSILKPGASTTFKVTFSPKAAGTRSAAIHIASNDPDEKPFDIQLGGEGVE